MLWETINSGFKIVKDEVKMFKKKTHTHPICLAFIICHLLAKCFQMSVLLIWLVSYP